MRRYWYFSKCLRNILFPGVPSQDIAVSTRQPEYLSQLVDDGAAYYDNQRVRVLINSTHDTGLGTSSSFFPQLVQSSKVIIIACLPGQLQRVSASVKGKLKRRTVLISILSTASPERIQTLFNHPLVVTTQLVSMIACHLKLIVNYFVFILPVGPGHPLSPTL